MDSATTKHFNNGNLILWPSKWRAIDAVKELNGATRAHDDNFSFIYPSEPSRESQVDGIAVPLFFHFASRNRHNKRFLFVIEVE